MPFMPTVKGHIEIWLSCHNVWHNWCFWQQKYKKYNKMKTTFLILFSRKTMDNNWTDIVLFRSKQDMFDYEGVIYDIQILIDDLDWIWSAQWTCHSPKKSFSLLFWNINDFIDLMGKNNRQRQRLIILLIKLLKKNSRSKFIIRAWLCRHQFFIWEIFQFKNSES